MPQIFGPNLDPRYYAQPAAFRCTIGAAAITAFPAPANATALQALTGVQASGTLTFSLGTQPVAGSSVTINGVTVTFVAAPSGFSLAGQQLAGTIQQVNGVALPFQAIGSFGLQVMIGATTQATMMNLLGLLRCWPDESLQACHCRIQGGNVLVVTARTTGIAGNTFTLAASASPVSSVTASGATLAGGLAPTSGYAVLIEPQPHPVEITYAAGVCRASQTAGTMTLFLSDGAIITKCPKGTATFASATAFGASQENAAIPFSAIGSSATLIAPPWTGLYAYGSTTQVIDIEAGPGGAY